MTDKKSFNPETDIEFSIEKKLKDTFSENSLSKNSLTENNLNGLPSHENAFVNANTGGDLTKKMVPSTPKEEKKIPTVPDFRKAIFFDFGIQHFQNWILTEKFSFPYFIAKDLTQLTTSLKNAGRSILFLHYSSNPKAMEQLVPQIESKFSSVLICLCVQNLDQKIYQQIKIFFPRIQLIVEFPLQLDKVSQVLSIP